MRYKVNLRIIGAATVEIVAETPAAAREAAIAMSLADLARPGQVDVHQFEVAVREITATTALTHGTDDTEDDAPQSKSRPSGWYRPR